MNRARTYLLNPILSVAEGLSVVLLLAACASAPTATPLPALEIGHG